MLLPFNSKLEGTIAGIMMGSNDHQHWSAHTAQVLKRIQFPPFLLLLKLSQTIERVSPAIRVQNAVLNLFLNQCGYDFVLCD